VRLGDIVQMARRDRVEVVGPRPFVARSVAIASWAMAGVQRALLCSADDVSLLPPMSSSALRCASCTALNCVADAVAPAGRKRQRCKRGRAGTGAAAVGSCGDEGRRRRSSWLAALFISVKCCVLLTTARHAAISSK